MTSQAPGWYDDPYDPALLRYWDGILWTSHVVPKVPPATEPAVRGQGDAPTASGWPPGWSPATPPGPGMAADPSSGANVAPEDGGRTPTPMAWHPGTGYPVGPRTRDGAVLAGWWRRAGAFTLDWILVNGVVWILSWLLRLFPADELSSWWERSLRAAAAGQQTPALPDTLIAQLGVVAVVAAMFYLVYDVVGLSRWGATLGRLAVGIRVRLNSRPGPLSVEVAIRRSSLKFIGELTAPLPFLGTMTLMFAVMDRLWPLRDPERQSFHDKVASTVVVLARP
ncbi:MAG TPA: RDD family protein [Dermatophilaceae bacterium]|nr:RDD family protein [Dermatophilaceae bacterium]